MGFMKGAGTVEVQNNPKKHRNTPAGLFLNKDPLKPVKVAGFIAKRIAFNRQRSFSRFIIRISVAATAISVMVMIISLSLANGFKETVSNKVFSFIGHIRVLEKEPDKSVISEETPIQRQEDAIADIRKHPQVQRVHAFTTRYAILKTTEEIEGLLVKGFGTDYDTGHLAPFLLRGRAVRLNDSSYSREILLSASTADRLKLDLNDRVLIYFIRPDGSLRPDRLTIVGIYKTGIEEYDRSFAIGDMKLIQRLNEWAPDEVSGYEIFLRDYRSIDRVAQELYDTDSFPVTWNTVSARTISPNIFDWLNLQDKNTLVLMVIIAVVAFINLITCFLILVLERVRMIGVLKSLGATNWTVQSVFLRHAALIALTGILIGTLLALAFLWTQQATGFIRLREEAYYVSEAAVRIVPWQVLAICGGTLSVCFLILLIPSLLVRKIQPVRAVQFR
jgi:lipoprotein-releasing system permease protein